MNVNDPGGGLTSQERVSGFHIHIGPPLILDWGVKHVAFVRNAGHVESIYYSV